LPDGASAARRHQNSSRCRTPNFQLQTEDDSAIVRPGPLDRLGLRYFNATSECICSERFGRHRNLELEWGASRVLDWFLIEGLRRSHFDINVSSELRVNDGPSLVRRD